MKLEKNTINFPNLLSFYRLLAIPFIIWSCFEQDRNLFIILITINLMTDIVEELIVKTFIISSEFGAKLDAIAEVVTFLVAVIGFLYFENEFVLEHYLAFYFLIGLHIIGQWFCIIKFNQSASFQLYSNKFSSYIQWVFIITYFIYGYSSFYFYFMIIVGCLAKIEVILLVLLMKKKVPNVRSIFVI
jgi:cardiolipin synthase (CMP-forming)